jgi:hypothetical protein
MTFFYMMMALPIVGPTLHLIFSTALAQQSHIIIGLARFYAWHIILAIGQALLIAIYRPDQIPQLANSYYQQFYGFIVALVSASLARQVAFLMEPFIRILGFCTGSSMLTSTISILTKIGLTIGPVALALSHNNHLNQNPAPENARQYFSINQIGLIAYTSFLGAFLPARSFGVAQLHPIWRYIAQWTGAHPVLQQLQGENAINATYDHFIGLAPTLMMLAETTKTLFFSQQRPAPHRDPDLDLAPAPADLPQAVPFAFN